MHDVEIRYKFDINIKHISHLLIGLLTLERNEFVLFIWPINFKNFI
jgi:hypothetical protein